MNARARKPGARMNARTADRRALYEIAVQRPDVMIGFIEELFAQVRRREPRVLREDFAGTAHLSSTWAAGDDRRRAVGIDNDPAVLAWARRHNVETLGEAGRRVELVESDVMDTRRSADVVVALNFSHFIYKRRADLRAYLRHARRCVRPGGMFICDAFGGPGSIQPCADERHFGSFTYIWEQKSFNPLTNETDCRIHFRFPNGSTRRNAFRYDWRMWSLPELRELLEEAGFDDLAIYFESEDGYIADVDAVDCDAWVAYLVALRD
jgi:SAM-dependent methyltransferase